MPQTLPYLAKQIFRLECSIDDLRSTAHWGSLGINTKRLDQLKWCRDHCKRMGIHIDLPSDKNFPQQLKVLKSPPWCLFRKGEPNSLVALSVVGSRNMSELTQQWLNQHLLEFLDRNEVATCSGGAMGVDREVHRLSMFSQKPTVVFLPNGFGYQSQWQVWEDLVPLHGGVVYSQFPPLAPVQRSHFHQRNRLIAAYGKNLLLGQAASKSGSSMTAHFALELGRDVGVVPGHPSAAAFAGCLRLAQEGAQLVLSYRDIEALLQ